MISWANFSYNYSTFFSLLYKYNKNNFHEDIYNWTKYIFVPVQYFNFCSQQYNSIIMLSDLEKWNKE